MAEPGIFATCREYSELRVMSSRLMAAKQSSRICSRGSQLVNRVWSSEAELLAILAEQSEMGGKKSSRQYYTVFGY
jgi:hypothetical protein